MAETYPLVIPYTAIGCYWYRWSEFGDYHFSLCELSIIILSYQRVSPIDLLNQGLAQKRQQDWTMSAYPGGTVTVAAILHQLDPVGKYLDSYDTLQIMCVFFDGMYSIYIHLPIGAGFLPSAVCQHFCS